MDVINFKNKSFEKIYKEFPSLSTNEVPEKYDSIELDQYIIMPNHLHGILTIKNRADARPAPTISDIICSFKSLCTNEYIKYLKQNNLNKSGQIWQRSFHDHIIRNKRSLDAIRKYICLNHQNWENDIENLLNI